MSEYERLVMSHISSSSFVTATSYSAAVNSAGSRTSPYLDMAGFNRLDVTVEVTNVGTGPITAIFVAVRSTARQNPDLTDDGDWSRMNRVASVDKASGVDTSVPLIERIDISAAGRHTVSLPVTNRYVSAIVWADAAGGSGRVYMYRANR